MDEKLIVLDLSKLVVEHGKVPNEKFGYSDPAIYFDDYTGGTKPFRITLLNMGVHSGTHCDTPSHFLFDEKGPTAKTISDYEIASFVGRASILDFYGHGSVTPQDLAKYRVSVVENGHIPIIMNGKNEMDCFTPASRAELASWNPKLIIAGEGWDHVSPEDPDGSLYPDTEYYLRHAQIPVIMNIDHLMMSRVRDGDLIVAAPIKLQGVEAAPVRLLAIKGVP